MNPIRILIYTDYDQINENDDLYSWGITELKKLITYKTRRIAEFKVDLKYRYASKLQPQRLTPEFLYQYQQLWVLCFNTARMAPYELDGEEVDALKEWMDRGGGLLVAGDHAAGFCDISDPKNFNTHGRSLGEPMKRAGQLRVWQGPPTACVDKPLEDRDNFNTCEGDDPQLLDSIASQSDNAAVNLLPTRGPLHRLFWWTDDKRGGFTPICKFPDHPHESKLVIPAKLDVDWPANSPVPVIAAKARDRRFPNEERDYILVVAYDGDPAKVGRIVADSSFHHYLNINLVGLPERDSAGYPKAESDLDQVAQFYGNLALWLTPRSLRNQMKLDCFFQLAIDPDVFEVRGSGIAHLGEVARYVLAQKIGSVNLRRVIASSDFETGPKALDELLASILLGQSLSELTTEEHTIVLGAVIEAHHRFFVASGAITPDWLEKQPEPLDMIGDGLKLAINTNLALSEKLLPLFQQAVADFAEIRRDS
ncbi:MAG: hypothetical protein M3R52_12660 [Acidobacteriota bacterium]|nr:hypothetical protein [Acidobacteriota bacterium]